MNLSVRKSDRHRISADIRVTTASGFELAPSAIDLSPGGVGTDGLVQLDADIPVRITFPDGTSRTGRSLWHEDFSAGILFDRPLTPTELAALIRSVTRTPRFR